MNARTVRRSLGWTMASMVAAALFCGRCWSQESPPAPATPAPAASAAPAPTPPAPAPAPSPTKARGRLPAHFSTLVSSEQRQKIYDVQASYADKIATLQRQIVELRAKLDQDVDGVLSAEQLAQIKKLREAAAAKRQSRTSTEVTAANGQG
jgi:hypothetical protein